MFGHHADENEYLVIMTILCKQWMYWVKLFRNIWWKNQWRGWRNYDVREGKVFKKMKEIINFEQVVALTTEDLLSFYNVFLKSLIFEKLHNSSECVCALLNVVIILPWGNLKLKVATTP